MAMLILRPVCVVPESLQSFARLIQPGEVGTRTVPAST